MLETLDCHWETMPMILDLAHSFRSALSTNERLHSNQNDIVPFYIVSFCCNTITVHATPSNVVLRQRKLQKQFQNCLNFHQRTNQGRWITVSSRGNIILSVFRNKENKLANVHSPQANPVSVFSYPFLQLLRCYSELLPVCSMFDFLGAVCCVHVMCSQLMLSADFDFLS
jgi:hypothetical protein